MAQVRPAAPRPLLDTRCAIRPGVLRTIPAVRLGIVLPPVTVSLPFPSIELGVAVPLARAVRLQPLLRRRRLKPLAGAVGVPGVNRGGIGATVKTGGLLPGVQTGGVPRIHRGWSYLGFRGSIPRLRRTVPGIHGRTGCRLRRPPPTSRRRGGGGSESDVCAASSSSPDQVTWRRRDCARRGRLCGVTPETGSSSSARRLPTYPSSCGRSKVHSRVWSDCGATAGDEAMARGWGSRQSASWERRLRSLR